MVGSATKPVLMQQQVRTSWTAFSTSRFMQLDLLISTSNDRQVAAQKMCWQGRAIKSPRLPRPKDHQNPFAWCWLFDRNRLTYLNGMSQIRNALIHSKFLFGRKWLDQRVPYFETYCTLWLYCVCTQYLYKYINNIYIYIALREKCIGSLETNQTPLCIRG